MQNDLFRNYLPGPIDERTEELYQEHYFEESLKVFRIAFPIVIFLYAIFGLLDQTVIPEHQSLFHFIRYIIVVPFLSAVYICSFFSVFRKIWQVLLFFSFLIGGLGIIVMIVNEPENFSYYAGLMLVFSAGYFFIKLRFYAATLGGWTLVAVFNIMMFYFAEPSLTLIVSYNFFYIAANIINMMAAYYIEVFNRQSFLLNLQLEKERKALAQANENLDSEVLKRTRELTDRERELRDSNSDKDRFISIIGHDLRSPMGTIREISDIIYHSYDEFSDKKRREYIKVIRNSASNTFLLLENLLQLARARRGHISFNPELITLTLAVDTTLALLSPTAHKKKILLTQRIPPDAQVKVDPLHLETILRNLLSNAIKFSKPQNKVEIDAQKIDGYVQISVRDHGVGIPESVRKNLFNLDRRVYTKGTDNEKGTGLGLILCKEFVEKNGGRIWLESPDDGGSIFRFILPAN